MPLLENKSINIWKEHQIVPGRLQVCSGETSLSSKQKMILSSTLRFPQTLGHGEETLGEAREQLGERQGFQVQRRHVPHLGGRGPSWMRHMKGMRDLLICYWQGLISKQLRRLC